MFCPNPTCAHRKRTKKPAEFMKGVAICSDCGSPLSEAAPIFKSVRKPQNLDSWTCPQCGLVNRGELPLCSCGYNIKRLQMDRKADKVPWPDSTSASPMTDKQKLLIGYLALLSGLLLTIALMGLHNDLFTDKDPLLKVIQSIIFVFYIIMGIELLWQKIQSGKKNNATINIWPTIAASAVGVYTWCEYYYNLSGSTDGLTGLAIELSAPFFQIIVFGVFKTWHIIRSKN